MNLRSTLCAATLCVFTFGAFAQAPAPIATPGIDARQAHQETRIESGVAAGAITSPEAHALQAQQNRVGRVEDRAKADGVTGRLERRHIAHIQNKANRDIRHQTHDAQHAAAAPAV